MQYQPTVPMPPPQGQPQRRNTALIVGLIAALLLGGGIGFVVSMSGDDGEPHTVAAAAPAGNAPAAQLGTLEVVSVPADGTVTVDGRLVGLTPIDRLDLDPGRHAVVIEVHGYQPYVGTITIEAGGAAALEAHLAELGGGARSTGSFTGAGKAVDRVPTTPAAAAQPEPEPERGRKASRRGRSRDRDYEPTSYSAPAPVREPPRRDCSAEESACASKCDDAHFSCWSSCKYCGSCVSSMTWDECNRICNTCKQGCEQNKDFCEASCEGIGDACRASQ